MAGADDLDIGIAVHANPDAQAVIEALRAKLAELRSELASASAPSAQPAFGGATASAGAFAVSVEQARQAMANAGGDFEKFKAELLALKEAHDAAAAGARASATATAAESAEINAAIGQLQAFAKTVDATSAEAVQGFAAESAAVRQTIKELGGKADALRQVDAVLASVQRRSGAVEVPIPTAGPRQLGPDLLEGSDAANALAATVNRTIGEFTALGRVVDTTSAQAVQGFRAQGDAVRANLAGLGATEAQLNAIAATVAKVERTSGAASVAPAATAAIAAATAPIEDATRKVQLFGRAADASFTTVPRGARTAANAFQVLSVSVESGVGSMSSFVRASGNAAFGLAQLSSNANIVAGAAGFGAVAIVVGTIIELFTNLAEREERVNKGLGDLSNNLSGVGVDAIQARLVSTQQTIDRLSKERDVLDRRFESATASPFGLPELISLERPGGEIDKLDHRLKDLFDQRTKLQAAAADAQAASEKSLTELTIKSNQEALESFVRRTQGEAAAQRQRIADEAKNATNAARTSGDTPLIVNARIASIEKEAAEARGAIDQQESQKIAERRATEEARLAKQTSDTQVAAAKTRLDTLEGLNAEQRAKRLISERQFIQDRLTLELKAIGQETSARDDAINAQIAQQQKLLAATVDPAKRAGITGAITALTEQKGAVDTGAQQQIAQATSVANTDIADVTRKLGDAVETASRDILDSQGQLVAAATVALHKEFDDLILEAEKAGNAVAATTLKNRLALGIQQAAVRQTESDLAIASSESETSIARTNALLAAHAITTNEARSQIVAALTAERDATTHAITELEAEDAAMRALNPDAPGNPAMQLQIDQYQTKLVELNLTIARTSDALATVKETAIDASENALAGFFEGLAKLGTQGNTSQIRALTTDLQGAEAELKQLLAIPASQRSGEVNSRITELRGQIAATSTQLDQAKASITTWRDLFVNALQSIGDALVKVSSQMLATAIIEKLLGLGVTSAVSASGPALSGGPTNAGGSSAVNVATGGFIRGPGTATSDSIPARLSDGEYVVNAERTARFLPVLHAINFAAEPPEFPRFESPTIESPTTGRRYAGGGYVAPQTPQLLGAPAGARDRLHVTVDRGLVGAMIKDYMSGNEGREITLTHVRANGRQLGLRT